LLILIEHSIDVTHLYFPIVSELSHQVQVLTLHDRVGHGCNHGLPAAPLLGRIGSRVGLVALGQTFVHRRHLGWTASEPPHFSRNGTPPRDENRRCIPSNENWLRHAVGLLRRLRRRQRDRDESRRFLGRPRSAPWFAAYDLDDGGRIAVQIVGGSRHCGPPRPASRRQAGRGPR
jgi:hypothetical protein